MRVLVADDDATCLAVIAEVLKREGLEVTAVPDGGVAWELLQKPDAPSLVILDWMMPEVDGIEVVRRLRATQTERPPYVLILTTRSEKSDVVAALAAGANDYITKPFDIGELRARVAVGRRMVQMQDALLESRETADFLAHHDSLTGLLNRRAILERLHAELTRAARGGTEVAVAMCDIDQFKRVNDTHGHQVGDDVLCGVARGLEEGMREYDRVGRIGGEEFLLVAPLQPGADALTVFARLCPAMAARKIPTRAGPMSVTVSMGVARAAPDATVDGLLETVDAALYRAKNQGRNCVVMG